MSRLASQRTTILVVEDEPLVLMDAAQTFEEAGFEVVDAHDGEHALAKLEERPDIAALFTDVNMPGRLDGVALARIAYERRPDLVLVITSAATKVAKTDIPDDGRFVPKPYDGRCVAALIKELLG